jgi:GNAT superfamily N-acetyltransferase
MSGFHLRRAVIEDAPAAVSLLRASIVRLCVDDHHNDPDTLALWLRNKTTLEFSKWLANPDRYLVVADNSPSIVGVGSIANTGQINLLYVQPGFQRMGVGRAVLSALEAHAVARQLSEVTLQSSLLARSFYERQGYVSTGPPQPGLGLTLAFPYMKALTGVSGAR